MSQLRLIRRFLRPDTYFLEIGPGDCSLSHAVARQVRQVYAVDVSELISSTATRPANFELILSNGVSIPMPQGTVTVAYSYQLMEHLHPDDALEQLRNVYKALSHGGVYVCITPNALSGPHDISGLFDQVATGFHLKEYTNAELCSLFVNVGFSKVRAMLSVRGRLVLLPVWVCRLAEWFVHRLPRQNWPKTRRPLAVAAVPGSSNGRVQGLSNDAVVPAQILLVSACSARFPEFSRSNYKR